MNASFIRALTYRSTDGGRFSAIHKEITELKKNATKRETERKEMADVVEQDNLIEHKRPLKLPDTHLRPNFEGKRSAGDVEIHQNGIRWSSHARSDHKVDILFSNIKHLFFQPCDHELVVLIHAHLKSPIMVGKKKSRDITFVREVSEASFDETGNKKRRRRYDEDEIEDEQEELRHRARLNKEFKAYADKISDAVSLVSSCIMPAQLICNAVQRPLRCRHSIQGTRIWWSARQIECSVAAIYGLSSISVRSTSACRHFGGCRNWYIYLHPRTRHSLTWLFSAHLERVQYGLRNFDLVFVMQDFKKTPVHINAVPAQSLEEVKDWLDSVDIPFSEGPVNLNWSQIMKTVTEDPYEFYKEGGWSFLAGGDGEGGDSDEEESSAESAFDPVCLPCRSRNLVLTAYRLQGLRT
jgi:nucleosome binding factor SPN SPT16 subunit